MNCFKRCFSSQIMLKDTIKFIPQIKKCTVVSVYDGDTITIASKLPFRNSPIYRWSLRIYGIDCPEMKTRNDKEKEIAIIAKQLLEDKILHKQIILENIKYDKYGRLLASVFFNKEDIAQMMVNKKLAVPYFGKKKDPPQCWKQYYNS
jgi:micrococcal nuclease